MKQNIAYLTIWSALFKTFLSICIDGTDITININIKEYCSIRTQILGVRCEITYHSQNLGPYGFFWYSDNRLKFEFFI